MATRNIVPRESNEGSLGTSLLKWGSIFTNNLSADYHNLMLNSSTTVPSSDDIFNANPIFEDVRIYKDNDPVSSTLFNKITQQLVNRTEFNNQKIAQEREEVNEQLDNFNTRLYDLRDELIYGSVKYDIIIPKAYWLSNTVDPSITDKGEYLYHADIVISRINSEMIPHLAIVPEHLNEASKAGFCATCETLDKTLRVYSRTIPAIDIKATLCLLNVKVLSTEEQIMNLAVATMDNAGIVKPGHGLNIDSDGTIFVDKQVVLTEDDMVDENDAQITLSDTLAD